MSGSLFLVGPMGAGKSTVGRRLAKALAREFIDSDQEIERRTGVDIPLIFELEGETGFRSRERSILAELTGKANIVLATGGGAVLDPENRRCLDERGFVIYLRASIEEQLRRTAHDTNRPLLQTSDPAKRLDQLMQRRDPLYREIADLIVCTDGQHVRRVVRSILQSIGKP